MSAHSRYPTLVIHGFFTVRLTNLPIHWALRRHGLRTYNVPIPGWNTQDIRRSAAALGRRVDEIAAKYHTDKVNLVGISMGGVILAYYVRKLDGHRRINRGIMLGSPVNGAGVAQFFRNVRLLGTAARQMAPDSDLIKELQDTEELDTDLISVYADGDSMVPPEAARLANARNVKAPVGTWPLGHYQLITDPRNLNFIAQELLRET